MTAEFGHAPAVNGNWYWVSVVREASNSAEEGPIVCVTQGTLVIEDIDSYPKRRDRPDEIINGKISGSVGRDGVVGEELIVTDIFVGRRSTEHFTYEWKTQATNREGISIISYYLPPRRRFLCFKSDPPLREMTGRFYSTHTANSGHSWYWKDDSIPAARKFADFANEYAQQ